MALTGRWLLHVVVWREQVMLMRENFAARHIIVGSDPTRADLVIAADDVAGEHALIEHDGERVVVHDLGGSKAVVVGGVGVERAQVGAEEVVWIGRYALRMCVLHAATVERWRQTLAHDDLAVPPPMQSAENAASDATGGDDGDNSNNDNDIGDGDGVSATRGKPADGVDLSWVLPNAPEATRRALLASLPPDAALVLRELQGPARAGRGLALLKIGHRLEDYRLVRRSYVVPKSFLSAGRYEQPVAVPSPLRLAWQEHGEAVAVVPAGLPWVLHRPTGVFDMQAGVRENWAYRGRSHVRIKLAADDRLHVRVAPTTYVVGIVALPVPAPRTKITFYLPPWPLWRRRLRAYAAGLAAVLVAGALGASWLWQKAPPDGRRAMLAPPARHAPSVLEAHFVSPPASLEAATLPSAADNAATSWPADAAGSGGRISVPGGSHGYRLFGMVLPEPLDDPTQVPGARIPLPADKAFLRGIERDWGRVLQSVVGGPPWMLDCDAQDVQVSSTKVAPLKVAQALLAHPEAILSCYAKSHPDKRQARLGLTLTLTADGHVRRVVPLDKGATPGWLACLGRAKNQLRTPKFSGSDVTARVWVTLLPWPSS